ncbi:MAG: 50S ribosomal protein L23 [Bacilli bacterium]|nr:50S ribosomal protein L23 [Bacilli bacterium]
MRLTSKIDSLKILLSPIITEKTTLLKRDNKIVLRVKNDANKKAIKKAFQDVFNAKVLSVNIINVKGKTKYRGPKRLKTKTLNFKKAIITLAKDQKIDLFE